MTAGHQTMRGVTMTGFGGVDRVAISAVPRPAPPGPRDVMVRLQAAALNRVDLFVLRGLPRAAYDFPHVLGADGAGVVEEVGPDVQRVRPGDRVMINPGVSCGHCEVCLGGEQPLCRGFRILGEQLEGTLAELVVVPEANVAPIGDRFSWAEAAAFPLATLTAWRMLVTRARLRPGETVLIWGVGGGVALAALQIAKLAGARPIVTSSSAAKLKVAQELGAEVTLDHSATDVAREVRGLTGAGVDVVVDTVGQATWRASLKALRPMGRLVTCGATTGPEVGLDLRRMFWFQWSLLGSTMGNQGEFQTIARLARQGQLRPVVDSVTPFPRAVEAFTRLAEGRQLGKLVIEVAA